MTNRKKKVDVLADQEIKKESVKLGIVSIAFDRNSNLYGVTSDDVMYKYDFNKNEWKRL